MEKHNWKLWGAALVALFVLSWFLWNHYKADPNTSKGNWSKPPAAAPIPEEVKPGPKQIVVLNKQKAVRKLDLPSEVKDNPSVDVLATADARTKHDRIQVVTFMNLSTGRTEILTKEIPKPFIRFENVKELGVRYGYDQRLQPVGDVHGRFQFLGVGPAKLGVYGEITTKGEGRAVLDLSGEF